MKIENAIPMLTADGFEEIGKVSYGGITVHHFWNPSSSIEACIAQTCGGGPLLLKCQMHYFLKNVQDGKEILGRDLEPFIRACEATFPELHLQFSMHRDLPDEAIARRLSELNPRGTLDAAQLSDAVEELERTRREMNDKQQALASCRRVAKHISGTGLAESYIKERPRRMQHEVRELHAKARSLEGSISTTQKYIKAYRKHGRGAAAILCAVSNLHIVSNPTEFSDALRAAVKQVTDADKYIVRAKLGGGLRVFVETLRQPAFAYAAEFAGGIPNLEQLSAAGEAFKPIFDTAIECTMVAPNRDIVIDGTTKDEQKTIGPRLLKAVIERIDRTNASPAGSQPVRMVMPGFLGRLVGTDERFVYPLEDVGHFAIVGPTGCGKSFQARGLVEEALENDIAVIIIDPRDQWAGMALPEDRTDVLRRYPEFELEKHQARGCPIAYYAPGDSVGLELPSDLSRLAFAKGASVISVQRLGDRERCTILANVIESVFKACCAHGESEVPQVWILVEEFHNFMPLKVADNAKGHAKRAMGVFDTVRREGRKFGLLTGFIATSFRDLGGVVASTGRLNTTSLIVFKTRDLDLKYVSSFIDPKRIEKLGQYEAFLCGPRGDYAFIARPPYSKVSHIPDDVRHILFGRRVLSHGDLTEDELRILKAACDHRAVHGEYANLATVMGSARIRSKGKLEMLIHGLEIKGYLRTEKQVDRRGSPRIIIPLIECEDKGATNLDEITDETGTKSQNHPDRTQ